MAQTVVILGAGESGIGAALLAQKKGWNVFVSDMGNIKPEYKKPLEENNISYEEGKHSEAELLAMADLVIKSPGIPDKAPLVKQFKAKGTPIIDEMEFAYRYKPAHAKIIGITGSNGKTTTTRLIHHLLVSAGKNAALVGNVGFSFAQHLATQPAADFYVAELSSFQLDGLYDFKADIGILLNITPDHLDRYEYKFEKYIASKMRILQNQTASDTFIYNAENEATTEALKEINILAKPYSLSQKNLIEIKDGITMLSVPFLNYDFDMSLLPLKGQHNAFNMACAVLAAEALGLGKGDIALGLKTFVNEAHRLQYIQTIHGVDYINDSKATNVDSVFYALDAMTKPTVWIVGGVDKGNDYSPLFNLVKNKVKAIVCLGKDNSKIRAAFEGIQPIIEETISMGEAIKVASLYAAPNDVVLLSPACASFDLFANYKERGQQFIDIINMSYETLYKGRMISMDINLNPNESKSDN